MATLKMKQDPVTVRRVRSPSEVSTSSPMAQIGRNPSEPSLLSRSTASSGPSGNNPSMVTSTWGIGWLTPTLMLAFYVLAAAIAGAHLVLFFFLNGKNADGPHRAAPQSYISTASNILANAFGFALRGSLSIAFVQYLWHLLRVSTMKVSTIELLFSLRSNPFQVFRMASLRATPTLCLLAIVTWLLQIATGFPPGAITVITVQKASNSLVSVPTFNASFMGNASGLAANEYSLVELELNCPDGFTSGYSDGGKSANLITRLARQVLIAGDAFAMDSPCGVNCSYTVEFEGPYVDCANSTSTMAGNYTSEFAIYSGQWNSPSAANLIQSLYNGTYTLANFSTTTLTPISVPDANSSFLIQQDNVVCTPGRANYTVNNTYVNNVHTRYVTREPINKLINLAITTHESTVIIPGFCANVGYGYGTAPANWSAEALAFYRDNNMMAIFDAMMSWLEGEFIATLAPVDMTNDPGGPLSWLMAWEERVVTLVNGVSVSLGAQNGTVIDSTRFNAIFGQYSAAEQEYPSFNMSEDILNDYLLNMTTSIMTAYGRWNESVNATGSTATNVYSFSQPLNLIIPYFLSLFVAVPFLVLGFWALTQNGVSAIDNSFTQIITTSTGSAILDTAAAGGCLGGNESAPKELKDLKIRFGEFIGRKDPGRIKRAGFGVDSEVVPLKKGDNYGIARWI